MENTDLPENLKARARETTRIYSVLGAVLGVIIAWLMRPSWGIKPSLADYWYKNDFPDHIFADISTMLIVGAVIGFIIGMAFATLINRIEAKS